MSLRLLTRVPRQSLRKQISTRKFTNSSYHNAHSAFNHHFSEPLPSVIQASSSYHDKNENPKIPSKSSTNRRERYNFIAAAVEPVIDGLCTIKPEQQMRGLGAMFGINEGHGSGFFIRSDGIIITNAHVVQNQRKMLIEVGSNQLPIPAKVIAKDDLRDLAILVIRLFLIRKMAFLDKN